MKNTTIGFIIWCIGGNFYLCLAVYIWFSKRAIPLWGKEIEVTDIRKYNHAMSKLYIAYGLVFVCLGIPLLAGRSEIILSIVGVVTESIILQAVYSLVIKKRYKK